MARSSSSTLSTSGRSGRTITKVVRTTSIRVSAPLMSRLHLVWWLREVQKVWCWLLIHTHSVSLIRLRRTRARTSWMSLSMMKSSRSSQCARTARSACGMPSDLKDYRSLGTSTRRSISPSSHPQPSITRRVYYTLVTSYFRFGSAPLILTSRLTLSRFRHLARPSSRKGIWLSWRSFQKPLARSRSREPIKELGACWSLRFRALSRFCQMRRLWTISTLPQLILKT